MKVFDYENWLPVDVDETLISKCPEYGERNGGVILLSYGEDAQFFTECTENIALIKHHKIVRGYGIVVWSANGKEWAEKVVRRLGLEKYVDLIMTKPHKYLDDKPVSDWMPCQIYLGNK